MNTSQLPHHRKLFVTYPLLSVNMVLFFLQNYLSSHFVHLHLLIPQVSSLHRIHKQSRIILPLWNKLRSHHYLYKSTPYLSVHQKTELYYLNLPAQQIASSDYILARPRQPENKYLCVFQEPFLQFGALNMVSFGYAVCREIVLFYPHPIY